MSCCRFWFGLYETDSSFIRRISGIMIVARIPRHCGRACIEKVWAVLERTRGCVLATLTAYRYALHYLYSLLRSDAIDVVLRLSERETLTNAALASCRSVNQHFSARTRGYAILCGVLEAQVGLAWNLASNNQPLKCLGNEIY